MSLLKQDDLDALFSNDPINSSFKKFSIDAHSIVDSNTELTNLLNAYSGIVPILMRLGYSPDNNKIDQNLTYMTGDVTMRPSDLSSITIFCSAFEKYAHVFDNYFNYNGDRPNIVIMFQNSFYKYLNIQNISFYKNFDIFRALINSFISDIFSYVFPGLNNVKHVIDNDPIYIQDSQTYNPVMYTYFIMYMLFSIADKKQNPSQNFSQNFSQNSSQNATSDAVPNTVSDTNIISKIIINAINKNTKNNNELANNLISSLVKLMNRTIL